MPPPSTPPPDTGRGVPGSAAQAPHAEARPRAPAPPAGAGNGPLAKLVAPIRQLGWGTGLLYLLGRALQAVSGRRVKLIRYLLVAQPVPPAAPDTPSQARPPARPRPAAVRFVPAGDPLVAQFPRPAPVIARRYAGGARCLAVLHAGERFAGFLWFARDGYDEDEVRCRYEFADPARSAWDFDVYVKPEYRLGRSFARLWDAANAHLAADGVAWSFSRISAFNAGSLAAHARLGIRPLFSATFLCAGPLQLAFLGAAPYLHLSLSPRSRPRLRLALPHDESGHPPRHTGRAAGLG